MEEEERREEEPKEEQPRPVSRAPAPVPVQVVETAGPTSLVEWERDGVLQRGYVPAKEVQQGAVSERTLRAAMPYGVPWAKYAPKVNLSPEDIEAALRRRGIWTLDDIALQRASVGTLLFELFGLTDMIRRVSKARK